MKDYYQAMSNLVKGFDAWAERIAHDMQPLIQALAASMPKPKIVDRRRLSARRARRRTERKMRQERFGKFNEV